MYLHMYIDGEHADQHSVMCMYKENEKLNVYLIFKQSYQCVIFYIFLSLHTFVYSLQGWY